MPTISERLRYRVVPFKTASGTRRFTLIAEWFDPGTGRVFRDERQQMSENAFLGLRREVNAALEQSRAEAERDSITK